MERMVKREPLPGHPIYATAAHTIIFQHRPIHMTEICPSKTKVALLGAAHHKWQEETCELPLVSLQTQAPHGVT